MDLTRKPASYVGIRVGTSITLRKENRTAPHTNVVSVTMDQCGTGFLNIKKDSRPAKTIGTYRNEN